MVSRSFASLQKSARSAARRHRRPHPASPAADSVKTRRLCFCREHEFFTPAREREISLRTSARHIAIIFHDFSFGGTEVIALKLAAGWVRMGRQVTILCGTLDGPLRSAVPAGVVVKSLEPEIGRSLFSRLRLRRALPEAIHRLAPDIVFLPGNFHVILAGAVRKLSNPPKVIAKISNPLAPHRFAPLRWLTERAFRFASRDVDCLVAMSTGLGHESRNITNVGVIEVIFDPNVAQGAAPPATRSRQRGKGPLRIVAAGRLVGQKDFGLAIRTIAHLSTMIDVRLTILGDGPCRKALLRLVQKLGVSDRVALPGHVPDIAPTLRQSDLLLVTSHYEGGPAVAIEAIEQGIPVATTDCSYFLQDLLGDGVNGIIIPSRDPKILATAISKFWARSENADGASPSALMNYQVDTVCRRYLDLFDRCASSDRFPSRNDDSNNRSIGRGDRIRTCDPLVPNQVRYQPAPLPDWKAP